MTAPVSNDKIFDVRTIPCSVKHQQILDRWINLTVGDYFVLKNDHDPVPLRYQFEAQFPDCFTWVHLKKEPQDVEVKIQKVKSIDGFKDLAFAASCGNH